MIKLSTQKKKKIGKKKPVRFFVLAWAPLPLAFELGFRPAAGENFFWS